MKFHLANAIFGVVDYLAYPLGILLLAPVILRALGVERYGIWAMASATLSTGAIIASGFGDANIRAVAMVVKARTREVLLNTVRCAYGIHLIFGLASALLVWITAPVLTRATIKGQIHLQDDCLWSLRITAMLILLRAIETVCVSTQRAFSRYGAAIQISMLGRMLSLLSAWIVPLYIHAVAGIMMVMLGISTLALWGQFRQLKQLLGFSRLTPLLDREITRSLLGFGVFTWLQSVASLLFGQIDRIIAGFTFGAAAVASYAFCVQLAQPIYGLTAAGLHFVFPYLASQVKSGASFRWRRSVLAAVSANLLFVAISLLILICFGKAMLRTWAGPSIALAADSLLPPILWSAALAALTVTGSYSLLALGGARMVAFLNILAGLAMVTAIPFEISRYGLTGIAYARLFFGPVVLFVYIPLLSILKHQNDRLDTAENLAVCEEV